MSSITYCLLIRHLEEFNILNYNNEWYCQKLWNVTY
jgi:hypothetical protein